MKLAVVGSRNFKDYDLLKSKLNEIHDETAITMIVSGGAQGADSLGEFFAQENNIPTLIFKPDWKKFGKAAGVIRNEDIIKNADHVIAFWDGNSKGTQSSINLAKKYNKKLSIILYN